MTQSPARWPMEVEHRLTVLEARMEQQGHHHGRLERKVTLQERMTYGVIIALNALAHEKLPEWAKLAAGVFKVVQPGP